MILKRSLLQLTESEEQDNADVDAELQKEIKAMERRLEAKVCCMFPLTRILNL